MFGTSLLPAPATPFARLKAALVVLSILLMLLAIFVLPGHSAAAEDAPVAAESQVGDSGLPLPRFATTRSSPINVRIGPGTRYGVAWIYMKPGTPVEIIQEFDTWRKIRDADGSEGWVHQNLLSGKRAAVARPQTESERIALLAARNSDGGVRAWLARGFRVEISKCDGAWCEVSATHTPDKGSASTYWGFVEQSNLWGVYRGEEVD